MNLSEDQIVRLAQFIYEWSGIGEWRYIGTIHQTAYIEKARDILAWIEKENKDENNKLRKLADEMAHEIEEHYATYGIYCSGDMALAKYKAFFPRKEE